MKKQRNLIVCDKDLPYLLEFEDIDRYDDEVLEMLIARQLLIERRKLKNSHNYET